MQVFRGWHTDCPIGATINYWTLIKLGEKNMATTAEGFCKEFVEALSRYAQQGGSPELANWFGRLLARYYHLDLDGVPNQEEELKQRLANKDLVFAVDPNSLKVISSDVTGDVNSVFTITGVVKGPGIQTFEFEHVVEWTLRARSSTFSTINLTEDSQA
jgi:hypothetical protein